jgi:hypothetical protein
MGLDGVRLAVELEDLRSPTRPADEAEQEMDRRLAGAGRPEAADHLAGADVEAHLEERLRRAERSPESARRARSMLSDPVAVTKVIEQRPTPRAEPLNRTPAHKKGSPT